MDNRGKHPQIEIVGIDDYTVVNINRGRKIQELVRFGPNQVHAVITHPDGSIENLGVSENLLTNVGRDLLADGLGALGPTAAANVATATSATSLTDSGEAWTTNRYSGWTVVAEESTNTPTHGNIGSNTGTVLTIDSWKNSDDSAGTTPGSTANYFIFPTCRPRYMGLTTNASAASASNTTLTGEETGNGVGRALATYAHTAATATYTLTKAFSVSGTVTAIHRGGLFSAANTTAAGIMVFETVLNQDATVGNGDTLTVTWTVTLSG